MPLRPCAAILAALVLASCAAAPAAEPDQPVVHPTGIDPPSATGAEPGDVAHEIVVVADLGALPDGSGRAVVTTTWTTDAAGTVRFAIETPAGLAEQHVHTATEHWWWMPPPVRPAIVEAEWIRFDLDEVAAAGGTLPDVVAAARRPPPELHDLTVGDEVAGRAVLAVEVVRDDEIHLTVAGIERPVIHRRRALPASTRIDRPAGAVDVADLPGALPWLAPG